MDTFATEFSQVWLADKDGVRAETLRAAADDDAGSVAAALEALANRVTRRAASSNSVSRHRSGFAPDPAKWVNAPVIGIPLAR